MSGNETRRRYEDARGGNAPRLVGEMMPLYIWNTYGDFSASGLAVMAPGRRGPRIYL